MLQRSSLFDVRLGMDPHHRILAKPCSHHSSSFHDHYKFIEAPSRRSIVFGEHDYRYFLLLYCLLELEIYILSSPNFIIISKCVNPCLNQCRVEVIGKVLAGVFTSKTQEHLIFTIRKPRRVGFLIFPGSHSDSSKDKTFQRSEQKKKVLQD